MVWFIDSAGARIDPQSQGGDQISCLLDRDTCFAKKC